jgi:hypothetical protein
MTPTNLLPAIEALGEALAALEGDREKFRECEGEFSLPSERQLRADYMRDASQAIQHLANSGWTLTPVPEAAE